MVSLAILFVWGLLSPRSQWRYLLSWSYRNPYADEPSGAAYAVYRVIAGIGVATMIITGATVYRTEIALTPRPPAPPTAIDQMWGTPAPLVVNRVVTTLDAEPEGLVDQPILGYQVVDGRSRQPPYLFSLETFSFEGASAKTGLIGKRPSAGLVALDSASIVVRVSGDPACFPHAAVIREGAKSVRVGIFYGQPNPEDGSNAEHLAECGTLAAARNVSVLIPLRLTEPLGVRDVLTLAGEPILKVDPVDR